jgi:nucleotide-binding universal stress UspA family protein
MYKHLLIATDGSDLAGKAVAAGLTLAKTVGARVTVVNATEPWTAMSNGGAIAFDFPIEQYERTAAEDAERILNEASAQAQQIGVQCETVHARDFPAEAIVDTAKARGCDLIVMASHGRRGVACALLGSQATRVVTLSPIPVLICR